MAAVRRQVCQLSSIPGFGASKSKVLSCDSLRNVSHSLASKGGMQKIEMMQESNLSKFKAEVQSSQYALAIQGHHFSLLQLEIKKLRNDIKKMLIELRNDIEKMYTEQRLNLNLEMRKITEELSNQNIEINMIKKVDGLSNKLDGLSNKLDGLSNNLSNILDEVSNYGTVWGFHSLREQLKADKYGLYSFIGTALISSSIVGLLLFRHIDVNGLYSN